MSLTAPLSDLLSVLSRALDDPRTTRIDALPLGFRAKSWAREGTLPHYLGVLGFAREGSIWRRGEEHYEEGPGPSPRGYLTLDELDAWALELVGRAVARRVALSLPPMMELAALDAELCRAFIEGVLDARPGVRVVFDERHDPREQAALAHALSVMSWADSLGVLAEESKRRGGLDDHGVAALLSIVHEGSEVDRIELSFRLAQRLGCAPQPIDLQLSLLAKEPLVA